MQFLWPSLFSSHVRCCVMGERDILGHEVVGSGPRRVVIMNDWISDTSSWDAARVYLDAARFTFAFVDLRGYGRSRGREGRFTVAEAAADVLALTDTLGWSRFAVVGHSMTTLVALHLAQHQADRVERLVLLAPPPPAGFGVDDAALDAMRAIALADDAKRTALAGPQIGGHLSPAWTAYKVSRWRATADPAAVAGYIAMFARDGLPTPAAPVTVPVLAITGERDGPPMRSEAVTRALTPLCQQLTVTPLADSGHYPMQEMPPLTAALVERFLG
jgi:3-oxoadipate enol-lactonase